MSFASTILTTFADDTDNFKDSKGRIWHDGQQKDKAWGGWIKKEPKTAEVKALIDAAKVKADKAGYDHAIFHPVSWAQFPDTVKMALKTGNGVFDVT